MHKDFEISIDPVAKIEGHASLDIKVREGEVKDVKFRVEENKRFYTQAIRGKDCLNVPQLTSRICGTCSIAHMTCCTEAVEKALGVKPSEQTMTLRNLAMNSLMIRDHALHLYFFCLPDVMGVDSVLDLVEKRRDLVHEAFHVKEAGNMMGKIIAGRAVHPTYYRIGGIMKTPSPADAKKIIGELKEVRPYVLNLIDIYSKCSFEFRRKTDFVSLVNKNYNFLEGYVESTSGLCVEEKFFWDHLNRVIIPYSQATGFQFEGHEYMVGALARLNLNRKSLHRETRKDAAEYLKMFPSDNVYHNNIAQAIEILHAIDRSMEMLETTGFREEPERKVAVKKGDGVGVIEAPRGTLYYMLTINEDGSVRWGNIVIPTAQNQIKIERDLRELMPSIIHKPEPEIKLELEKIIRAYDPCMSCASHFLKLRWI